MKNRERRNWFGEDSQIKVGRCDLWWDPQNVHKGAILRHERCSALISAHSMLYIKEEGKSSYPPPQNNV